MSDQPTISPPYMSYGVFKSAIETLADAVVPSGPLDRRVLDKLSGADHGALMSGLTFLGYVEAQTRRATSEYRKLINAWKTDTQGTDKHEYQVLLYEALNVKYADIVGGVDIETGTGAELEKAFKAYGVPAGQMLTKTIRFYIRGSARMRNERVHVYYQGEAENGTQRNQETRQGHTQGRRSANRQGAPHPQGI